jgi:heme oxygenase
VNHSTITLRERLRNETKDSHLKLDALVNELAPFASVDAYRVYLRCLDQLYSIYGEAIDWASVESAIPQTVSELRQAIENDIGVSVLKVGNILSEPAVSNVSEASKWAAAYVMEGSAMGARMIVKQSEQSERSSQRGELGNESLSQSSSKSLTNSSFAPQGAGSSYLVKLASDSYQRWPAFVAALAHSGCHDDDIIDEAKNVFCIAHDIFANALSEI